MSDVMIHKNQTFKTPIKENKFDYNIDTPDSKMDDMMTPKNRMQVFPQGYDLENSYLHIYLKIFIDF